MRTKKFLQRLINEWKFIIPTMTLEAAAKDMVSNAFSWVEAHRGRDRHWIATNLPSVFIQGADILKSTVEFPSSYKNRDFLNSSSLLIRLDENNSLLEVKFFIPSWGRMSETEASQLNQLNDFMKRALEDIRIFGLSTHYRRQLLDRIDREAKNGKVDVPVMYDTRKIDMFNFK